jgi:hypothetical protein
MPLGDCISRPIASGSPRSAEVGMANDFQYDVFLRMH